MGTLSSTTSYTVLGGFVILKDGSHFRLGVKPARPGATVVFLNLGSAEPSFSGTSPLTKVSSGNYTVQSTAASGPHYFNLDGDTQVFPYSINVQTGESGSALFRVIEGKPRVVVKVQPSGNFALNFRKGLTSSETFTDAVYVHCGGTSEEIPLNQEEGYWEFTNHEETTMTFTVSEQSSPSREVIGGEDGDLDIEPDDG